MKSLKTKKTGKSKESVSSKAAQPSNPTPVDRPDTRTRILIASEKLFGSLGYESTSIRAVAREAQVNLALINYHFGSKDELYRELILSKISPFRKELEAIASDENLSGGEKLECYINAYSKFANSNSTIMKINLREITKESMLAKWFAEEVIGEFFKHTIRIITEAYSDGSIRGDISPVTFIPMIVGSIMLRVVALPILARGSGIEMMEDINSPSILKEMKDVLFNGIKAR